MRNLWQLGDQLRPDFKPFVHLLAIDVDFEKGSHTMIEMALLGKPRVRVDGRLVERFPTAKTVALLAYLAHG